MLSPSEFRDLVSGRRRGAGAAGLRALLRLAEVPYAAAVRWRNHRFDTGHRRSERVGVPVVSVGNLTLGGTGKTPLVEWLARRLRSRGVRVTIVSRGYGAPQGSRNDEALELEQKLPDVPHVQDADRVAAARMAVEEFECQFILADDAFQHRRLARDLDIVLIDALEPLGFGHVFPRGTLREPLSGLARADVLVLSRADMLDEQSRSRLRLELGRYAPRATWVEAAHAPRRLLSAGGDERSLDGLCGQSVAAFCGIGNPAGFRHSLARCGARLEGFREFDDHYAYTRDDVVELSRWADGLDIAAVICTHKDLVKLGIEQLGQRPLWALSIELQILAGQADLEARLLQLETRPVPLPPDEPER